MNSKPKLLLIQPDLKYVPLFLQHYLYKNMESAVAFYFDVTLLTYDKKQIVNLNAYQVDLICFQATPEVFPLPDTVDFVNCTIPKIVLIASDALSPSSYAIYDFAHSIKADALFTIDVAYSHISKYGWDNKLFFYPWSIDTEVYHDYNLAKDIRFLRLGHTIATYPWRKKMFEQIEQHEKMHQIIYPSLNPKPIITHEYSKWINRSKYTLSCGGFNHCIVNKHLEIPASRSVLVTQGTQAVKAMGFVDGVNCIFCDSYNELCEKIKPLDADINLYNQLANRGYEFIRANHNRQNRKQLIQWFNFYYENKNQIIKQPSLTGDLVIDNTNMIVNFSINDSDDKELLNKIDMHICLRETNEAKQILDVLLNEFLPYSNDFLIRAVIIDLLEGNTFNAFEKLNRMFQASLLKTNANRPEPIIWAVFLMAVLKSGASKKLKQFAAFYQYDGYRFFDFTMLLVNRFLKNQATENNCLDKLKQSEYLFYSNYHLFDLADDQLKKLGYDITGIEIMEDIKPVALNSTNILVDEIIIHFTRATKVKKVQSILDFILLKIANSPKKKLRTLAGIAKRKAEAVIGIKQ